MSLLLPLREPTYIPLETSLTDVNRGLFIEG